MTSLLLVFKKLQSYGNKVTKVFKVTLQSKRFMRAPLLQNFDWKLRSWEMNLWIETSKLQVATSQKFSIFLETLSQNFVYYPNLVPLDGLQSKSQSLQKGSFQGRSKTFYEVSDWSFEVSIQSFILNFEVSDQSFEVRRHAWTVLTIIPTESWISKLQNLVCKNLLWKHGRGVRFNSSLSTMETRTNTEYLKRLLKTRPFGVVQGSVQSWSRKMSHMTQRAVSTGSTSSDQILR